MPENPWKINERRIAGMLGGKRKPITGRGSVDIDHPWLAIEAKLRDRLPQWIEGALRQAEAEAGEKLPIAVLHGKGLDHADDLVVLRLHNFIEWFGDSRGGDND